MNKIIGFVIGLSLAMAGLFAAAPAQASVPTQRATCSTVYNDGGYTFSAAAFNPGAVYRIQPGDHLELCNFEGGVYVRTACNFDMLQKLRIVGWENWRPDTGWHHDSNGGHFRLVHNDEGCREGANADLDGMTGLAP